MYVHDVFTDNTQFAHTQIFLCAQVRFDNEFVELSLTLSFIEYSKVSIIRPSHSRLLDFEKKIVLVV